MSIAGILSSNLFNLTAQTVASPQQQFKQELQQLGKDLQAGNLSAAQADFATLQQNAASSSATAPTQSSNPVVQAFKQLGQDLQSGNLAAAQQDYSTIQQDAQSQSQSAPVHHHRHHAGGGGNSSGDEQNTIAQEFSQLSQALQTGNLSAAQQAYSTLQQSFQASTSATGGLQVTA